MLNFYAPTVATKLRTQKALGLYTLSRLTTHALSVKAVVQSREDCWCDTLLFPYFARPCPVTPQHGFVESRVVTNSTDLLALWDEMMAVDPNGEILLTPVYPNVELNALWTPSSLTIGVGHDGATAGKNCLTIPLVRGSESILTPQRLADAGITDDPYVEVIYPNHDRYILTQLRNGPRLNTIGPDYIPREMTVTAIISPKGEDLLQWQARLGAFDPATKAGLCVWHPGGSLTDHYAIHARQNGIALVTSFEPHLGDTLVPGVAEPPDFSALIDGLVVGQELSLTFSTAHNAVRLILLGLHHAAVMTGTSTFWTGLAAALLARLASTAALGEVRHLKPESRRPSREEVYTNALPRSLSWHRARIGRAYNGLRYGKFGSSAVGGAPWAACAMTTIDLFDQIAAVTITPSLDTYNALLGALNLCVSQAHHNGWWMNKFVGGDTAMFHQIAAGSCCSLIPAAPLAWDAHVLRTSITPKDRTVFAQKVASWARGLPLPPRPLNPELIWSESIGQPILSLTSRELKKARRIPLDFSQIGPRVVKYLQRSLTIHRTTNGYECRIAQPGKPPTILWREEKIIPTLTLPKSH